MMRLARRFGAALLLALLLACLCPAALAQERTVRVACFEEPGFLRQSGGGACEELLPDYLTAAAREAGWTVEALPCVSRGEALALLRSRRADLMGPVFALDAPEEGLCLSRLAMAETSVSLLGRAGEGPAFEDFAALDGLRTGVAAGSPRAAALRSFAAENGFAPAVVEYPSDSVLMEALQMEEVDLALVPETKRSALARTAARIAPEGAHFAALEGSAVMAELDEAMARLAAAQPGLTARLLALHFPDLQTPVISQQERAFARACGTLRVGLPLDGGPVADMEASGAAAGVACDLLDEIARACGLTFAYVPLAEAADLAVVPLSALPREGERTLPFLSFRCALVGRRGADPATARSVAVAPHIESSAAAALCPRAGFTPYASAESCLDAVRSGQIDAALISEYSLPLLAGSARFDGMAVLGYGRAAQRLCLQIPAGEEAARLAALLDKGIEGLDAQAAGRAAIQDAQRRLGPARLSDAAARYRPWLLAAAALLAALALSLALCARRRHAKMRALAERCTALSGLCEHSGEGILVLQAAEDVEDAVAVLGCNARLREMAGLGAEETPTLQCFPAAERARLQRALSDLRSGARVEMDTCLAPRPGEILPVRLRACAQAGDGLRVYVSLQDRSAEQRALEALELERAHSRLLLEQTGDAVFDIDAQRLRADFSPQFRALFGEARQAEDDPLLGLPFVPEDQGLYDDVREKVRSGATNLTTRLRARQQDGRIVWCDLRLSALVFAGKVARVVGRLTNVEEQISLMERRRMLALRDERTGLYTYTAFRFLVEQALQKGEGLSRCAVLVVEAAGDEASQRAAAEALRALFRAQDYLARCGERRCCVFAMDMPADAARAKAQAILDRMGKGGSKGNVGGVCGLDTGADFAGVMAAAEDALRQAAAEGPGQCAVLGGAPAAPPV